MSPVGQGVRLITPRSQFLQSALDAFLAPQTVHGHAQAVKTWRSFVERRRLCWALAPRSGHGGPLQKTDGCSTFRTPCVLRSTMGQRTQLHPGALWPAGELLAVNWG